MIVIDAAGVSDEGEFWERYVLAAQPEGEGFFGHNLDAFWDAVEGGGPGYPGKVDLHFVNMSALHALPNGKVFMKAFAEIASEAKFTKITWSE
jgi:ribonuclease inhibitor